MEKGRKKNLILIKFDREKWEGQQSKQGDYL